MKSKDEMNYLGATLTTARTSTLTAHVEYACGEAPNFYAELARMLANIGS